MNFAWKSHLFFGLNKQKLQRKKEGREKSTPTNNEAALQEIQVEGIISYYHEACLP
ncbi:hypothetical protein BT69DRAFT_1284020 [Atractiella rhizophila]|nr:hypothetical protein BT69DRAFT_1284020 [Atractiella rhizophila]